MMEIDFILHNRKCVTYTCEGYNSDGFQTSRLTFSEITFSTPREVNRPTRIYLLVGVLRHTKYLKAALHSTHVSFGTIAV